MKVLDLFSGIGGFALGLERAGMETVAFCEYDEKAQLVLKKHWPNVPIYNDVKTLTEKHLANDGVTVDVICGGFPCQDVSNAGTMEGLDGKRSGLWSEYARLIGEIRPSYALIENVSALLIRGLDRILCDLASIGYDAEWHCIPASYVGAWHRRDRVWIIAYPNSQRLQRQRKGTILRQSDISRELDRGFEKWPGRSNLSASRFCRTNDGIPNRSHRLRQVGNAVIPQIPQIIARAIMEYEQ